MSETDLDNQIEDLSLSTADGIEPDAADAPAGSSEIERTPSGGSKKKSRQVTLSLGNILHGSLVALLAVATGMLGWLYLGAQHKLDAQAQEVADRERAQHIAIDYAVNAAEMDYQDFNGWKVKLVKGTSPELKEKLTEAASSMEQLLAPMQWTSTARPLSAIVKSNASGVYTVDAFVSVLTKTVQAPEGLQSTATYSITIDSRNDWLITDVGGIDAALGKSGG